MKPRYCIQDVGNERRWDSRAQPKKTDFSCLGKPVLCSGLCFSLSSVCPSNPACSAHNVEHPSVYGSFHILFDPVGNLEHNLSDPAHE
jgi:hypothetical protein